MNDRPYPSNFRGVIIIRPMMIAVFRISTVIVSGKWVGSIKSSMGILPIRPEFDDRPHGQDAHAAYYLIHPEQIVANPSSSANPAISVIVLINMIADCAGSNP